jgi:hypothetical protein
VTELEGVSQEKYARARHFEGPRAVRTRPSGEERYIGEMVKRYELEHGPDCVRCEFGDVPCGGLQAPRFLDK